MGICSGYINILPASLMGNLGGSSVTLGLCLNAQPGRVTSGMLQCIRGKAIGQVRV